jgi:hypothetical protein
MRAVAIALIFLGFIAGCARLQSMQSSVPPSPSASSDRPDLLHRSASACEQAGRQWNGTSGICM